MRLIDADAMIDRVKKWDTKDKTDKALHNFTLNRINEQPTVDAQPVRHGHWIIKDNPGTGWYRVICSECGEDVTSVAPVIGFFPNARVTWDFCPECGARMDGEQ